MPLEPSSPFQTPAFNEAGQDMLYWTLDWQRRRKLAALGAAQKDADAGDSGDETISGSGTDDAVDSSGADSLDDGEIVVLPDGSKIADSASPTGYLMSPIANHLGRVVTAARLAGFFRGLSGTPLPPVTAAPAYYMSLGINLGHGGTFDYQRQGNSITGYTQYPQFRNVSNFNVGLFGQQAGLSLDETLRIAGAYAGFFSNNANPNRPHDLDEKTEEFIARGYEDITSGIVESSAARRHRSGFFPCDG